MKHALFALLAVILAAQGVGQQVEAMRLYPEDPRDLDFQYDQDRVGHAVAIDGDWVIVTGKGADTEDGFARGAIYFYKRTSSGWVQTQVVRGERGTFFGESADLDGHSAIVGSLWGHSRHNGSVHILELQGDTWFVTAKLLPSEQQNVAGFGRAVAIDGDTAIVGAQDFDGPRKNSGAAFVYEHGPAGWVETQILFPYILDNPDFPTPSNYTAFGMSVDIDGNTLAVASPMNVGAVTLFERDAGGSWIRDDWLTSPHAAEGDVFGWYVALQGDTLVVGNPSIAAFFSPRPGETFVFERGVVSPSEWSLTATLSASDGYANINYGDQFGAAVAVAGDRIVVGAQRGDYNGDSTGTGYLFERKSDGSWPATETQRLVSSNAYTNPEFMGSSVALSGGFLLVGAPLAYEPNHTKGGVAYLFEAELGTSYCDTRPNSTGVSARLVVTGNTDVARADLILSVRDTPPATVGCFLYGPARAAIPFGDGLLCVGGPVARLGPPVTTSSAGVAMGAIDFTNPKYGDAFVPGSTWYFQFLYADADGGPTGCNLSNAVELTLE